MASSSAAAAAQSVVGEPEPAPTVSLLVAVRNEEAALEACLRSILAQRYPAERLEILVIDGDSTDRSRTIAQALIDGRQGARVLRNAKRTQAAGWNLGIDEARGAVVGIVSGHVVLDRDYVRAAVEVLSRTGADMVGGPVAAFGDGPAGRAIARAISTPFGVGGARFRYLRKEEFVDTVFMGIARRHVWRAFRFDEEMARNQDDELSYRMLDAGLTIVCSPAIRSTYRSRSTFRDLARQYADYGFWKVRVLQKHPAQARIRHVVPAAFVLALAGSLALAPVSKGARRTGALAFVAYAFANAAASAMAARQMPRAAAALLPVAYAVVHVSYGSGVLAGLLAHRHWTARSGRILGGAVLGRAGHSIIGQFGGRQLRDGASSGTRHHPVPYEPRPR